MTNQTIPPCPVCGVVPELVEFERPIWVYCCGNNPIHYSVPEWSAKCTTALGRACRELGIETVEQLMARLAPDPRVAVLEAAAISAMAYLDGMLDSDCISARSVLRRAIIAAQRGEVEG